mmetsp:Transcript_26610/g.47856  ORF Transcript_26610/g.47856 Transcript_26610/m.47856 type:complete len:460 (-) Transcript_26610:62-1441(-)
MSARVPSSQPPSKAKVDFIKRNREILTVISQRSKSAGKLPKEPSQYTRQTLKPLKDELNRSASIRAVTPHSEVAKPVKKSTPIPSKLKPLSMTSPVNVELKSASKPEMTQINEEPEQLDEAAQRFSLNPSQAPEEGACEFVVRESIGSGKENEQGLENAVHEGFQMQSFSPCIEQLPVQEPIEARPESGAEQFNENPTEVFSIRPQESPAYSPSVLQTPDLCASVPQVFEFRTPEVQSLASSHSRKMNEIETRRSEIDRGINSSIERIQQVFDSIHQEVDGVTNWVVNKQECEQEFSPVSQSRLSFASETINQQESLPENPREFSQHSSVHFVLQQQEEEIIATNRLSATSIASQRSQSQLLMSLIAYEEEKQSAVVETEDKAVECIDIGVEANVDENPEGSSEENVIVVNRRSKRLQAKRGVSKQVLKRKRRQDDEDKRRRRKRRKMKRMEEYEERVV